MKLGSTISALALAIAIPAAAAVTPLAGGTSCASPTVIPPPGATFNDTGNSCTGTTNNVDSILSGCTNPNVGGSGQTTHGPEMIYSITTGGSSTPVTFTVTPNVGTSPNFDPKIYLLTTCGNGSTCVTARDSFGPGVAETLATTLSPSTTYYFYIDSFFAVGNGQECGAYSLSVAAGLPVELTNFSVN